MELKPKYIYLIECSLEYEIDLVNNVNKFLEKRKFRNKKFKNNFDSKLMVKDDSYWNFSKDIGVFVKIYKNNYDVNKWHYENYKNHNFIISIVNQGITNVDIDKVELFMDSILIAMKSPYLLVD